MTVFRKLANAHSHPRIYRALKLQGHDPLKAAQIILDARRNDKYAMRWIKLIVDMYRDDRRKLAV